MPSTRTSGIYAIVNTVNGRTYIGQSVYIEGRWRGHRCDLKYGRHGNPHLQRAWNHYGPDAFTLRVLEVVEPDRLIERETFWITQWATNDKSKGYNCRLGTGYSGPLGEETRQKMSESARRKAPPTGETRRRMSEAQYQRPPATGETRHKLSAALMGHPVSQETIDKVRTTRRARGNYAHSEESRQKISLAGKGRVMSEETRRKMREINTGRVPSPETKELQRIAAIARFTSDEERRKTSESTRLAMADPAIRDKIRAHVALHPRPQCGAGEMNAAAKLSWEAVRAIRARHAAGGITFTALGAEFGVNRVTVRLIVKGRLWKEPE